MLCSLHHFLSPWKMSSHFCAYGGSSHHTRKTYQEESLIYVYNYHPFHCQKRNKKWKGFAFFVRGATSSLNDQSPAVCPQHFPHERRGSQPKTSFQQYKQYAHSPPRPFFVQDHGSDLDPETSQILPGLDLNLPSLNIRLTITQVNSYRQH